MAEHLGVILHHDEHTFVNLWVEVFEVLQLELLSQHHLIESLDKEAVKQLSLCKSLTNDSAGESEHCRHFFLDDSLGIRIVHGAIVTLQKQSIVCVKYALADKLEPLLRKPTFIYAFFVMELDGEVLLP